MQSLRQMVCSPLYEAEGRISGWINVNEEALIKSAKDAYPDPLGDPFGFALFATFVGGIASTVSVIWSIYESSMPKFGFIGYAILAAGIWGLFRVSRNDKRRIGKRESKQAELFTERATDPLFKRAMLLSEAIRCLKGHVARYGEQYTVFDKGLSDVDEQAAEKYRLFIERAVVVVLHGVDNFFKADRLAEQEKEFRRTHPGVAESIASTALTDLLTQLNEPVSVPKGRLLPAPAEVLAFEGSLADTERALSVPEMPVALVARTGD